MAEYNFEGDIDNINGRQLEYINNVIEQLRFKNAKVTFEPVGKPGDNYVANVKRITIEGVNRNLSLIAKIAPSHEMLRINMNSYLLFRNEHIMYTEVLPKMLQLQKAEGIPEEEQLKFAKCYGSLSEAPNEVILLEDLKTSGFIMMDRFESLSDECVKSVLKNFGILHSLSYVLKAKEPETYNSFKASLFDMWSAMAAVEETKAFFKKIEDNAISVLEDPEHINLLRNKVADAIPLAVKMAKLEDGNKYSVIQQGDSWTNNVLFRFEEDSLKQSIMIDYQLSKNNNPVCDILYLVLNCTDHETRTKYYYDWIDYYYSELDRSLFNFGLKSNYIYPRDQLDADLKRYAKLLFGLSIMLASVVTVKSEEATKIRDAMENTDVNNFTENMKVSDDNETVGRFRNRIIDLIQTFREFGLF